MSNAASGPGFLKAVNLSESAAFLAKEGWLLRFSGFAARGWAIGFIRMQQKQRRGQK